MDMMENGLQWTFQRDAESLQLLKALSDRDSSLREEAAQQIEKTIAFFVYWCRKV